MKRIIALFMVLALLIGSAAAESTLPQNYKDLQDKLYRQMLISGMSGLARITLEGDAEWAAPFQPLSDALIRFQTVTDWSNHTDFEAYITKNGTSTAHTRLWGDGTNLYLRSDLLIDTVLQYPWKGDIYSSLTAQGSGNPDYLSALINALIHADDWDEITAPLRSEIENWLMRYAETPEQVTENDRSLLCIRYRISVNDVKAEMKNLLRIALKDEDIYRQVSLYLTEEQKMLGFSEINLAYEDRVIDTLPITDGITIERRVSTMGENVSTEISLPLAAGNFGWTTLTILDKDSTMDLTLDGGKQPVAVSITQTSDSRGSSAWKGTADLTMADGKHLRADWTADRTLSNQRDENFITHEITILNFKAEPKEDSEVAFTPVNLSCSLHLYSYYDQQSDTTIEIQIIADIEGEHITLTAKMHTIDKYNVRDMDVTGAVDALTLTPEKRAEIRSDMLVNALLTLAALDDKDETADTPEPEDEPTPTPEPEPTPTPTPEPMPTPTPEPVETPTPEPTLPTLDEITEFVDLDEEDDL